MEIIPYMEENGHEELILRVDASTGLKTILAIHDTTLGPAMGPPMMARFSSESEAISYALGFALNHSLKCAMAGLPFGGGRLVVLGDPAKDKTKALVKSMGQFVNSLNGRYVLTGGGSGFTSHDTRLFLAETPHIIGLPSILGGSDDHAKMAAYGVFQGMKTCAQEVFGSDSLEGRTIAVSGIGRVGSALVAYLFKAGARLVVADPDPQKTRDVHQKYQAKVLDTEAIFDIESDIFSPCARAYMLTSDTIARLNCKIVAGAANNQLAEGLDGAKKLRERGILLAPEFVINAGSMINFCSEKGGYQPELARRKTKNIRQTLETVFNTARTLNQTPFEAACFLAKQKIEHAKKKQIQPKSP